MVRALGGIVLALWLFGCAAQAAQAEPRLALLIGNQSYAAKVGPLVNPRSDIETMGAALEKLGFTVTKLADAGKEQMDTAIRRYVDQVRRAGPGAVSFFYYSGHGGVNPDTNVNYLIPVDVTDPGSGEVWYRSIEQRLVIDLLSERTKNAIHFVVFDACRSELSIAGEAGKALGADKGFAPVADVRGMLIAYSTAAKKTAADTGLFAKILAEELSKKNLATHAFLEMQSRVVRAMRQEPWLSLGYVPPLYLAGRETSPAEAPQGGITSHGKSDALIDLRKRHEEELARKEAELKRREEELRQQKTALEKQREAELKRREETSKPPQIAVAKLEPQPPLRPAPQPAIQYEDRARRLVRTFRGHTESVNSVAFTPDGGTLASASADRTLKLWEVATGRQLRTLTGHTSYVNSVAFAPDGRTLASASWDNTLKLWDAVSGRELRTLNPYMQLQESVAFSPDGRMLASAGGDDKITLWDATSGLELRTLKGHWSFIHSIAFSPDGRTLASASADRTLKLWEAASGRELRTLDGHADVVQSAAFSPDGRTLASGSEGGTIKLWDAAAGRELRTLKGHTDFVYSVAFSPDGRTLASASWDHTLKLWDTASGKELRTLTGHESEVNSVAFSPDGRFALSGSGDKTLKLWDVSEWTQPQEARR